MSDVLVLNRDFSPLNILSSGKAPVNILNLSAIPWQRAIRGVFLGSLVVVHEYSDRIIRSPSRHIKMPSIVMAARYVRPKLNASWSKENLFLRDRYTCQYCLKVFPKSQLTLDHVVPASQGGPTCWTNIVAACQPCNGARGCDTRIQPRTAPYQPSYYELVSKAKEYTITIPDPEWANYLDWPEDKVAVRLKSGASIN